MPSDENAPLMGSKPKHWSNVKKRTMFTRTVIALALLFGVAGGVAWFTKATSSTGGGGDTNDPDFSSLRGFCDDIEAIQPSEYLERHARLAETLPEGGALVMEPGPTMLYYTNIEWSLSERPFLVVLQRAANSTITTTVVTPMFEATRALEAIQEAKLPMEISIKVVEWIEHGSPYETTAELLEEASHVFVEPGVRLFVYDGLADILSQQHGVVTTMASRALQTLRMVKSPAEIAIMRCANRATVAAAKKVRHHVKPGMTEADIASLVTQALTTAGLTNTWVLALVDENAAFPHGEPGATKRVTKHSTVLIDSGGELLGYQSDVTRTFFMDNEDRNSHNQTIVDAWYLVKSAQQAVLHDAHAGSTCAQVDLAARHVIDRAGYGRYFTHRLGHGIGEEMHEEPYMNQGNTHIKLQPGMTFSVEPGIYITHEFGIRLEDIVVVTEDGNLELLTDSLADNPWTL